MNDQMREQHASINDREREDEIMTNLERRLATTEFQMRDETTAALRRRLIERAKTAPNRTRSTRATRSLRAVGIAAAAITLVAVAFTMITPLRVWAQELIARIGNLQFTDETTWAEQVVEQQATLPSSDGNSLPARWSAEQASERAGFPVFEPAYLPENYVSTSRDVYSSESGGMQVISGFGSRSYTQVDSYVPDFISLSQWLFPEDAPERSWPVGDAVPTEVFINGHPGLWFGGAPLGTTLDENNMRQLMPVNLLIWEQDGYTFIMQNLQLSFEELLRVAESLRPVENTPTP